MKKRKPTVTETEHNICWGIIDRIAKDKGVSVSRLAAITGLDQTAFNKSKRVTQGDYRMPNMATVIAILRACNLTWTDWARYWDSAKSKMEV